MKKLTQDRSAAARRAALAVLGCCMGIGAVTDTAEASPPGEGPALSPRVTQDQLNSMTLLQARAAGRRIFSTPFNFMDGFGDGSLGHPDKVSPGGRPTLQDNGAFLRMNGLDSQSCIECHNVLSNRSIPARFAVGGAGGAAQSAFPGVINPDIDDSENNGYARIQGRMINPPFSFGAGGVELVAHEMTVQLQAQRSQAQQHPDTPIALSANGVSFGSITFDSAAGTFDISGVEGIGEDLVVRPFGRKGCCSTVRAFDTGALQFHHGMEPVEVVGQGVDHDDDGVADEILVGELSALHVFQAALEPPVAQSPSPEATLGESSFDSIGCDDCHRPQMTTQSKLLALSFPEVATDPTQNVYRTIDLSAVGFPTSGSGVVVRMYADLKLHDMGAALAEATPVDPSGVFRARLAGAEPPSGHGNGHGSTQGTGNGGVLDAARYFTTARLWGVADTAPYMHDGRALTLTDAILMHGGEAEAARNAFAALSDAEQANLIAFLRTLRTPAAPSADLP